MMERRRVLGAAGALAAVGLAPAVWAQRQNIVLGQSAALTGPASELGQQFMEGARLHFDKMNALGGAGGHRIELLSLDDGYEPDRCVRNTRRLIDSGVFALFGYIGTAASLAALPLAREARKLFFAPFTGSEVLRIPFSRHVFHLRASYVDETTAIVNHLLLVGVKRIGVFYQSDSDGKAGLLGVGRVLKREYLAPAGLGRVKPNSVDVDAAVRSILAAKPSAIVLIGTYRSSAAFIRAARKVGYNGMFCSTSSVGTQALARELSAEARGVIISQVMPYPFAATTRAANEYLAAGRDALGRKFQPSYGSIEGYLAARTFTAALRTAGNPFSQESVITALESLRDFDLGGFPVSYGPERHVGSRLVDLTILTEDGKIRH